MKTFRCIFALCLALALLLSAVGCGYAPVRSTEEERATVLTLDGSTYSVPYELYRFYFLSELSLTGKKPAELSETERAELLATLRARVLEELAAVYAVFSLSAKHDLDPEDGEMDDAVDEGIIAAVEGNDQYLGYGDFDTYLAEIKKLYMNDSVFRFLLRYQAVEARLGAALRDRGVIASDRETVTAYMQSDACVRASWIYIPYTQLAAYSEAQLNAMAERAQAADDAEFLKMTHQVLPDTYSDAELDRGFYLGKYQLDPYYQNLTDTVFSLSMGETSGWVDAADGRYLVRRLPKDEAYLGDEKNLADFTEYYLLNTFYGMLHEESLRLSTTVAYLPLFEELTLDTVIMPTEEP